MTDEQDDRGLDQLLAQLREEITSGSDGPAPVDLDDPELRFYSACLAEIPDTALDPRSLEAVDRLLERGEGVAPEQRERLIGAANRALRHLRSVDQPLQPLLAAKRGDAGVEADEVAAWLGVETKDFLLMESGATPLSKVSTEQTAQWIRRLALDEEVAIVAVRRSLQLVASGPRFGRRSKNEMAPAAIESYVEKVRLALAVER